MHLTRPWLASCGVLMSNRIVPDRLFAPLSPSEHSRNRTPFNPCTPSTQGQRLALTAWNGRRSGTSGLSFRMPVYPLSRIAPSPSPSPSNTPRTVHRQVVVHTTGHRVAYPSIRPVGSTTTWVWSGWHFFLPES
jgi:hypothetical protein